MQPQASSGGGEDVFQMLNNNSISFTEQEGPVQQTILWFDVCVPIINSITFRGCPWSGDKNGRKRPTRPVFY